MSPEQSRAPERGPRSALVVALPGAGRRRLAERTCADRPLRGSASPRHDPVPVVLAAGLGAGTIDRLHRLVARFPAFDAVLRELRRFPGVLYSRTSRSGT